VDLYDAGANVIVDDVTNGTEPFFQDGLVTQAIDYVASKGVPYFTAAGNEAAESYEGDYINSEVDLLVDDEGRGFLHDFDTSGGVDLFLNVTLQPDESLSFGFGYDEPSAAASGDGGTIFVGAPGQAPTSDYDVYVLDTPSASITEANVLAVSDFDNPTTGLPFESISYTNSTGSEQTVYIAFTKLSGADRHLKFSNAGGSGEALKAAEYVGASTALGHANAVGAFTLAATPYNDTAAFNTFIADNAATAGPAAVAESSSIGGGLIYLDVNGNRLTTPVDRMKPDATSSDGDNNTFFGEDFEPDGNKNFFGTSAAAPNAAAVAALMIQSAGGPGSLTPTQIYNALKSTAADLKPGSDYNVGTTPGYDIVSGVGFIRAEAAVAAVAAPLCTPASPLAFSSTFDTNGDNATFGEFATLQEQGTGAANLMGCTFAVFDPQTEKVTYSTEVSGIVGTEGSFTFATMDGDLDLPAETIPDGPGAFTLLNGLATVGQDVGTVLASASVVAGVVYSDENNVFASIAGGTTATNNNEAFLNGLRQIFVASEDGAEVNLAVVAAPNPVSGAGSVSFGLATGGDVRVSLYDALGREIARLAEGSYDVGRHTVALDASELPAGVYVVRVEAGGDARTSRLTIIR